MAITLGPEVESTAFLNLFSSSLSLMKNISLDGTTGIYSARGNDGASNLWAYQSYNIDTSVSGGSVIWHDNLGTAVDATGSWDDLIKLSSTAALVVSDGYGYVLEYDPSDDSLTGHGANDLLGGTNLLRTAALVDTGVVMIAGKTAEGGGDSGGLYGKILTLDANGTSFTVGNEQTILTGQSESLFFPYEFEILSPTSGMMCFSGFYSGGTAQSYGVLFDISGTTISSDGTAGTCVIVTHNGWGNPGGITCRKNSSASGVFTWVQPPSSTATTSEVLGAAWTLDGSTINTHGTIQISVPSAAANWNRYQNYETGVMNQTADGKHVVVYQDGFLTGGTIRTYNSGGTVITDNDDAQIFHFSGGTQNASGYHSLAIFSDTLGSISQWWNSTSPTVDEKYSLTSYTVDQGKVYIGMTTDSQYLYVTGMDENLFELYRLDLSAATASWTLVTMGNFGTGNLSTIPSEWNLQPKITPDAGVVWLYGRDGSDYQMQKNTNYGTGSWTGTSYSGQVAVSLHWNPTDPDDLVTVFRGDDVYRTTDDGLSWSKQGDASPGTVLAAVRNPTSPNVIAVGAASGDADISINWGEDWSDISDGSMGDINALFAMW